MWGGGWRGDPVRRRALRAGSLAPVPLVAAAGLVGAVVGSDLGGAVGAPGGPASTSPDELLALAAVSVVLGLVTVVMAVVADGTSHAAEATDRWARSRGASRWQAGGVAILDTAVLMAPATALVLLLAVLSVGAVPGVRPGTWTFVVAAVALGLAAVVTIVRRWWAAAVSPASLAGGGRRDPAPALVRDLVLVGAAVAAVALTTGAPPVVLAGTTPLLVLLALAALVGRAVPSSRTAPVLAVLVAALLVLPTALTTLVGARADADRLAGGAPVVVVLDRPPTPGVPALTSVLLAGVSDAAVPALVDEVSVGGRSATLLAVDLARVEPVWSWRDDLRPADNGVLEGLVAARPSIDGVDLPVGATALAVDVRVDDPEEVIDRLSVGGVVLHDDGSADVVPIGTVTRDGPGVALEASLTAPVGVASSAGTRLVAFDVTTRTPPEAVGPTQEVTVVLGRPRVTAPDREVVLDLSGTGGTSAWQAWSASPGGSVIGAQEVLDLADVTLDPDVPALLVELLPTAGARDDRVGAGPPPALDVLPGVVAGLPEVGAVELQGAGPRLRVSTTAEATALPRAGTPAVLVDLPTLTLAGLAGGDPPRLARTWLVAAPDGPEGAGRVAARVEQALLAQPEVAATAPVVSVTATRADDAPWPLVAAVGLCSLGAVLASRVEAGPASRRPPSRRVVLPAVGRTAAALGAGVTVAVVLVLLLLEPLTIAALDAVPARVVLPWQVP